MPSSITTGTAAARAFGFGLVGADPNVIALMVQAGGGGGGQTRAGGGGAGGNLYYSALTIVPGTTYNVTVGTGGAGSSSTSAKGSNGNTSSFIGGSVSFSATGGGGGGSSLNAAGASGGSGGGSCTATATAGGAGTAGQGNNGGASAGSGTNPSGGGGGGATAVGGQGIPSGLAHGGNGGTGFSTLIYPLLAGFAGGGGGGGYSSGGSFGYGALGGGGDGGGSPPSTITAAASQPIAPSTTLTVTSVTFGSGVAPAFFGTVAEGGSQYTGFTNVITIQSQLTATNAAAATTSATGTSGANFITVSSATGIVVGQFVGNNISGIPANTFVRSISGTIIELTNALTGNVSASVSFFTPGVQGTYTVNTTQPTAQSNTITGSATSPVKGKPGFQYTGGGGGGGGGLAAGGAGATGCVIISYPTTFKQPTTTGSPTVTTNGANTVYLFTGAGTITW